MKASIHTLVMSVTIALASGASAQTTQEATVEKQTGQGWQIADEKDPIDDRRQLFASIQDETKKATFQIGCKYFSKNEKFLLAIISLPPIYGSAGPVVTYRINSDPAVENQIWPPLPGNGNAVFIPTPYDFFRQTKDNASLFVRIRGIPPESPVRDFRFNLANISAAWALLTSYCPEPPPKPAAKSSPAKPKSK